MSEAHVYLLVFRKAPELRAHFSMYFVYPETIAAGNGTPAHGTDCIGLLLHITGQKQTHYQPYACHKFTTTNTKTLRKAIRLGTIPADMVPRQRDVSTTKIGNAFLSTPIPKQSFNIRARIDDVSSSASHCTTSVEFASGVNDIGGVLVFCSTSIHESAFANADTRVNSRAAKNGPCGSLNAL